VPALERSVAAQLVLIEAAWNNDILRIDEAIRNGADMNGKNRKGETALIKAVDLGPLLFTPLNYGTISYLLDKGADPTIQGDRGFGKTTALHLAIDHSSLVFGKESKSERMKDCAFWARKIIVSLLRHGAHVSAQDGSGMTPLHIAAKYNNIVGAKLLIEAGAKVMPRDDKGKTPLHYAESAEMIRLLKNHGAKEE
jgi:ankyrin repeat protein